MALEPRTSTVTVIVQPGQLLGLIICQRSNNVNTILPGLVDDLNRAKPGSIEVGDRVLEVNGEEGPAFSLISAWAAGLTDRPGTLRLTILRPVEFEVAIDISAGRDLGLAIMELGFMTEIACEGLVAAFNAERGKQTSLRIGDRIVQINRRAPSTEDGAGANVLPYLRLAMGGGEGLLRLRVRRGEHMPTSASAAATASASKPAAKSGRSLRKAALGDLRRGYSYLKQVLTPAALRSVAISGRLGRSKPKHFARCADSVETRSYSKMSASTQSTTDSLSPRSDIASPEPLLTLPGVVRRIP
jgi:hypothetical protein